MQIPTHILSGWCVGASLPLTARERLACMLGASLADLDGVCIVAGLDVYARWHHVVGHNVFYGALLAWCCARLALPSRRWKIALLCFALFHLHLVMDYYGSGPGWGLAYLWPIMEKHWVNPKAWAFEGWQNYTAMGLFTVWMLVLAWVKGPWPTELGLPRLQSEWNAWRAKR
jgi:inner membrane protein